jgi:predicted small metal-binding protein
MSWRKWRKKRSSTAIALTWFAVSCASLVLACGVLSAADKLKELQDHFDKESHASSKVRSLDKLADAQFESATKAIQSNDFSSAGLTFEKYRDNVRAALELLKKQEPDVDRHPGGYRQLELQVRKGIREVEEVQLVAPQELRPPLEIVHKDLIEMDDELIHLLFPRRSRDPEKVPPAEGKP